MPWESFASMAEGKAPAAPAPAAPAGGAPADAAPATNPNNARVT